MIFNASVQPQYIVVQSTGGKTEDTDRISQLIRDVHISVQSEIS